MDGEGYMVTILHRGEHAHLENGCTKRKSSAVLIRGPSGCMVVNPGSVWDGPELLSSLKAAGVLSPEKDITCVICTDGRAENVGCMSLFQNADMMIVGYDIQKRGDIFLEHDFSDGVVPYEFDENLYVIGTPGQRGHQVSLMVKGCLQGCLDDDQTPKFGQIAITGGLFADQSDASSIAIFDVLEGNHGDKLCDKENSISNWRRSRKYVLDRADWIIPAYGEAFKVKPEYVSTPCVELV